MGIISKVQEKLGIVSKEQLDTVKEQLAVQKLLMDKNDKPDSVIYSSTIAREAKIANDASGMVVRRVPVRELQLLYLNNQFIFRGTNVRADEMITRGYTIQGEDPVGVKACEELIETSGGLSLFWQLSVNTDVAGDGYLENVWNQSKTKMVLLRHINPISFGFETEDSNSYNIVVDDNGFPVGYMQTVYDSNKVETKIKVPKEYISHLKFNTFGDEFQGISSIQPVYYTAVRLMNMEQAAAEAAVKTANPTWIVSTKTKSAQELNKWTQILGRISSKEVVFLPDGVTIDLKSPGSQNFTQYSSYFLDATVAALSVPKSILTGSSDSGGGNRSTVQTLSKHFYSVIRANQRYVEELFNEIFRRYAAVAGFTAPKLVFNNIAEDSDRNAIQARELYTAGILTIEEARELIGYDTSAEQATVLKEMKMKPKGGYSTPAGDVTDKKADMAAWHPAEAGSPAGSQSQEKKAKKLDPNIPSV